MLEVRRKQLAFEEHGVSNSFRDSYCNQLDIAGLVLEGKFGPLPLSVVTLDFERGDFGVPYISVGWQAR